MEPFRTLALTALVFVAAVDFAAPRPGLGRAGPLPAARQPAVETGSTAPPRTRVGRVD